MANLERTIGTSAANTAQTVSTPLVPTGTRRLVQVTVAYSAAPTQTGVTTTLNNGAGAGYDALLSTGAANARYTTYQPSQPFYIASDDTLDVTAPAGGIGITSSIAIYTEVAA